MRPRLRALLCAFVLASCDATGPDPADLPRLAEQVNDEMVGEIGQSVTLTVRAIDGRNRSVAGAMVLWQIMAGGGRVEPASSRTGDNGFATVAFFPGSGENHVVARVQETNPSVSFAVHGCAACGVWTAVTALSAPRSWPGAVVLDGSIWLIGGDDQANWDAIDIFETASFTWRHSTPLPAAVIGSFTATVQQRIYVIGGYGGRGGSLIGNSTVSALDPAAGTWTSKSRLSQGRFFAAGAVLDGRIYVVGGYVNCDPVDSCFNEPLTSLEIYDPAADRWTAGPPMLDPRGNAGAAVLNGKLYVAGGSRGLYLFDNATATVEMFDPQSNSWSRKAPLPTPGHIRLVTTNNKLYAVVTWWQIPFARIYEYDPVRDAWSRLRDAPAPGVGAAVVANDGQLYIIGGYSQFVPFWQISSSVYVMRR